MMTHPWLPLLIESCSETGCERKLMVMYGMIAQGKLDSHRQSCHNFIYFRPVRRALLALPPSALRYTNALIRSFHGDRALSHSSCVCLHV